MTSTLQFENTHCAGRFDQSVKLFDTQMDTMMAFSDAIGVTEIDKNARARQLKAPGWDAIWGNKGPRDDCGITIRKEKFEVVYEETYTCSHATYVNDRGNRTDSTEAAFQIVKDKKTGELVLLGEVHTPHGMGPELRKDNVRSDVARAYVQITRAYLRRARILMKKFKVKLAALSGDWNLDFRLAWVRAWFRKFFGGWKMNWSYPGLPIDGTHGNRVIDGTLLKGLKPVKRRILRRAPGDDHNGYTERLVAI